MEGQQDGGIVGQRDSRMEGQQDGGIAGWMDSRMEGKQDGVFVGWKDRKVEDQKDVKILRGRGRRLEGKLEGGLEGSRVEWRVVRWRDIIILGWRDRTIHGDVLEWNFARSGAKKSCKVIANLSLSSYPADQVAKWHFLQAFLPIFPRP